MTDTSRAPPSPAIVAVARGLAVAHPGAQLPCPVCVASLRGDGLERHLATDHRASLQSAATGTVPLMTWTGVDRRVRVLALVPFIVWIVAVVLTLVIALKTDSFALWVGHVLGVWFLVSLAGLIVADIGVLRATLTFDGDALRLRHSLGLREEVVRLPATLESGRLRANEQFRVSDEHDMSIEVDFGPYLRLSNGRSAIVVGCKSEHEVGHHWDPRGWQPGRPRKAWSITVDPASFVTLEYALAGRRMLTPRHG